MISIEKQGYDTYKIHRVKKNCLFVPVLYNCDMILIKLNKTEYAFALHEIGDWGDQ